MDMSQGGHYLITLGDEREAARGTQGLREEDIRVRNELIQSLGI